MEVELALGARVDVASSSEVAEMGDTLWDRIRGSRLTAIPRSVPGSFQLPAGNYANGVQGIINFGSPAEGRIWLVRAISRFNVDQSTTIPTLSLSANVPPSGHFCVGRAPLNGGAGAITDNVPLSDVRIPFVGESANGGSADPTFSQPYAVFPTEQAYVWLANSAAFVPAKTITYFATLTVFEYDGSQIVANGM